MLTYEFEDFTLEQTDNYNVSCGSRNGQISVSCQEIMATAIKHNAIYGNGQSDKDIVMITGLSYNIISKVRGSEEWILAKESFVKLNPNLTDAQLSKLRPKGSNGSGGSGNSGIKFTANNAKNLGQLVWDTIEEFDIPNTESLYGFKSLGAIADNKSLWNFVRDLEITTDTLKGAVANFDPSNESDSVRTERVKTACHAFVLSLSKSLVAGKVQKEQAAIMQAEIDREKARVELEDRVKVMLSIMGVENPVKTEEVSEEEYQVSYEEYQEKFDKILAELTRETE